MKNFLVLASVLFLFGCGTPSEEKKISSVDVEFINSEILEVERIKKDVVEENFSIKLEYPVYSDNGLNEFISRFFTNSLETFEKGVEIESDVNIAWEFDGFVQKISEDDSQISLLYTEYQFTGGAHGNTSFATIVYDKKNRGTLTLQNFLPNTDQALNEFAQKIQAILIETLEDADEDWVKDGAGADFANFKDFVITQSGDYRIYFEAYQVAPYVNGPQIVDIKK